MKRISALLLAACLTASAYAPSAYADCNLNDELLKNILAHSAREAIDKKYHENRSWYPVKIRSITKAKHRGYIIEMDVPSCTIKNLYIRGVDHDDIVKLAITPVGNVVVLKVQKVY